MVGQQWLPANGSSRRSAAQADGSPQGVARARNRHSIPNAKFRMPNLKRPVQGTRMGLANGGSSQRDGMTIARHFNAGFCPQ